MLPHIVIMAVKSFALRSSIFASPRRLVFKGRTQLQTPQYAPLRTSEDARVSIIHSASPQALSASGDHVGSTPLTIRASGAFMTTRTVRMMGPVYVIMFLSRPRLCQACHVQRPLTLRTSKTRHSCSQNQNVSTRGPINHSMCPLYPFRKFGAAGCLAMLYSRVPEC